MIVAAGVTDQSVVIRIVDSTDGSPETGVVAATAGLALWYWRQGGTVTALTESDLAAIDSAHADGGMKHASDGYYRVDIPDAAFAAAADWVMIGGTVTGMVVIGLRVDIAPWLTAITGAGVIVGVTQGDVTWGAQTITTAGGDALTISATGANGDAVSLAGNGTGTGLKVTAGGTGYAIQVSAPGSTAVQIDGGGGGNSGVEINGPGSGIVATGTSDYGIYANGGEYGLYAYGGDTGLFTYGGTDYGQFNSGRLSGTYNYGDDGAGSGVGMTNYGAETGEQNIGIADYGEYNTGGTTGSYNNGTAEYGIQAIGGTADLDPMPAVPGDDMDLTVAALAQVNIQCDTALSDIDLDHLIQITAGAEEPTDGTYLDQIMHKDAAQTFDSTTDSLEAISDKLTGAQITVTSAVAGTTLNILRGDTLTAAFSGLGNIATRTKLWLTIKSQKGEADVAAAIQVLETNPAALTDGLQRLNGAATTAAWGSLTVTDAAAGNVTLVLAPAATSVLRETARYYDIQVLEAGGHVHTLTSGDCDINLDVTLAIV